MSNSATNETLEQIPEILNPRFIAQYLGIGYSKALKLVSSGAMPCIKVGNHYKIPRAGFIEWLHKPGCREYL
ncbi:MAG: excisionase family DNA-binding protein [Desulfitobacteriaceae bacterium]|nr:excisionase family DNA-binding protein [Desulfitobacteriaceae bacterium]